ncbi:fumarylacetoacetate hydrolase family protein [Rhizomonospora bruguierae]|uniref:fumarylacetoacetate hydrolase family protein n=1 Tax=Rhizomonospora bruguierae TaxID=1581705 RepID=UPI001BCE9D5F|nr:fumarylacetoacetate hydrolase family protein [Micromonospora sp. NBRC 107566]
MRIGRIAVGGRTEFAVEVAPRSWAPLSAVGLDYPDLPSLITDLGSVTDRVAQGGLSTIEADDLTLRCPVVRPAKMLAIGLNYADHARETGATPPERPVVFAKYTNSLNDPYGRVVIGGDVTQQADYEAELAVVIGRRARRVAEADAYAHVFGYAVANDVSARDWQRTDAQFSRSKSADTFCPVGPCVTTADEVPEPGALRISSRVNGEVRQDSTTAQMIFTIPRLIAFLSATITLEPGDVILTGTPPGVGLGFRPPRFLAPGDVVECEVEGLGMIRNEFVGA